MRYSTAAHPFAVAPCPSCGAPGTADRCQRCWPGTTVSSLYKMTPSEAYPEPKEAQLRVERRIARLVKQLGGAEVRRRIRESDAPDAMKAHLVLLAFTED